MRTFTMMDEETREAQIRYIRNYEHDHGESFFYLYEKAKWKTKPSGLMDQVFTAPFENAGSYVLWGDYGTGKTTAGLLLGAKGRMEMGYAFLRIHSRDLANLDQKSYDFNRTLYTYKNISILIIDEIGIADGATEYQLHKVRSLASEIIEARNKSMDKYLRGERWGRRRNTILISNFPPNSPIFEDRYEPTRRINYKKILFIDNNLRKNEILSKNQQNPLTSK